MSYCNHCSTCSVNGVFTHEIGCQNAGFDPGWFTLLDDGTLDTVIGFGNYQERFSDTSEYRNPDTGELDFRRFIADYSDELIASAFGELDSVIERWIDSQLEYETEHDDAGNNYAHLITEGYWPDYRAKILEYLADNFTPVEYSAQELSDAIDSIDDWDMRASHTLSSGSWNDGVQIESYAIGEIEVQIEISALATETGFDDAFVAWLLATNRSSNCVRYTKGSSDLLAYACTDGVWSAVVTDDAIETALESIELDNATVAKHVNAALNSGEIDSVLAIVRRIVLDDDYSPGQEYLDGFDLDSFVVATYWYATHYHTGQGSDLYSLLCDIGQVYSPGPMANGPETDSELAIYRELANSQ